MSEVGSRLRRERQEHGWTQAEVAEYIGSTRLVVGKWERGEYFPSPYYRRKLADLFGKSIVDLGLIPARPEEED